ncbi:uncharacterized protein LOC110815716 [Carica papaya]|uniref:uncharacterized protein LOC110815716 n=1 Tax=Carica papaya TaxID=3649 RepID=UPI000B8C963D|nr:uncharacterized protein LOC110815716 [Carica papaya]
MINDFSARGHLFFNQHPTCFNYFLLLTAIAALLQTSSPQKTHLVGHALSWVLPPTVFNFTNGVHDVSEVTKENFDACDPSNPFFLITTSPATIGLNKTGQHYFICTFSCSRTRSQPCLAGSDEVSDDFHRRRQFGMDGSSECLFLSGTEQWEELHGWWTSLFSTT